MPDGRVWFGVGLGAWNGAEVGAAAETLQRAVQADRDGLDLVTVADHPYLGDRLDAYATLGIVLGQTSRITGAVTVTNLPSRPAPVLARTVTSLSALSGGRVVLGLGAGGQWDEIVKLGVPRLSPGSAVRAMADAINLIRALSGGGAPVTVETGHYPVTGLYPAPVSAPPIWTGAVGPRSLAVTGRLADGWVPAGGADWLSPRYRESRPVIDAAAAAAGRDPAEIATIYNVGGQVTSAPLAAVRDDEGRWIGGSVGQWADELISAVLEHNATGFVYREAGTTPTQVTLGRWSGEIVPAVREAIGTGR
jgi:alkanesulfonate monooxygenase SsuD/methylene tetrahydromethanopterin reductase-like flavin-dependent oxidoreductase (luciferase family)